METSKNVPLVWNNIIRGRQVAAGDRGYFLSVDTRIDPDWTVCALYRKRGRKCIQIYRGRNELEMEGAKKELTKEYNSVMGMHLQLGVMEQVAEAKLFGLTTAQEEFIRVQQKRTFRTKSIYRYQVGAIEASTLWKDRELAWVWLRNLDSEDLNIFLRQDPAVAEIYRIDPESLLVISQKHVADHSRDWIWYLDDRAQSFVRRADQVERKGE